MGVGDTGWPWRAYPESGDVHAVQEDENAARKVQDVNVWQHARKLGALLRCAVEPLVEAHLIVEDVPGRLRWGG